MKNKPSKPAEAPALGYVNVRISKKAHRRIAALAVREQRTFVVTLDRILGV